MSSASSAPGPTPVPVGGAKEPAPARLVATLAVAGLLSGLAIVVTYEATLPIILDNQARALRAAVFEVVPGSTALQALVSQDGQLIPEAEGGTAAEVFAAFDDAGALLGYAITGEGAGFQDTIKLIFGFNPAGDQVVGMQVLESRETPGLGDKIYKDADFVGAFRSLAVRPQVVLVPKGSKTAPNEVDGITGATISSKAVVKIVNASLTDWEPRLPAAGEVPAPAKPAEPGAPDTPGGP